MLTETVFAWPGLGLYIKNSLFNADLNAVLGGTMLVGGGLIGLNMLSDLLYPLRRPAGAGAAMSDTARMARLAARPRAGEPASGAARALVSRLAGVPPQRAGDDRARRRARRWC